MENSSYAHVLDVGTVVLKFTSGKTVLLKNVHHVPSIKKNLVSGSQMCRDGFKIMLKSNKCVVSRLEHLLERVMIAEACSAYLCLMMCVIKW